MPRIRTVLFLSALSLAGGASAMAQPVSGQPGITVEPRRATTDERIDRLELALRDLQGAVYASELPDRAVPVDFNGATLTTNSVGGNGIGQPVSLDEADLSVRLSAIEQSLAQVTGQVETLTFKLNQQALRINQLEGSGSYVDQMAPEMVETPLDTDLTAMPSDADGGPMDLSASAPLETAFDLPDNADAAYSMAYESVLSADYDRAEAALEAFVEKFPDSPQTAEAKFLLGEVYLATGANTEAAKIFLDHVGSYSDDPRAPEAYLKLGTAFARLGQSDQACKVFRAGRNKFTDLDPTLVTRFVNEQRAAGCS